MARRLLIAAGVLFVAASALSTKRANLADLERAYERQLPTIAHIIPSSLST